MAIPCTSAIHVEKRFQKYSRAGARVKLIPGGGPMFLQTGVGEPDEGHTLTQYQVKMFRFRENSSLSTGLHLAPR